MVIFPILFCERTTCSSRGSCTTFRLLGRFLFEYGVMRISRVGS